MEAQCQQRLDLRPKFHEASRNTVINAEVLNPSKGCRHILSQGYAKMGDDVSQEPELKRFCKKNILWRPDRELALKDDTMTYNHLMAS